MLQEAIRAKDFEKVKEIISATKKPFEGLQPYHITGIYDTLIREQAFDVIDTMIESGALETDIYEYDSFDRSIFMSIIKHLKSDETSIDFLNHFIPKIQSLNDELAGKSVLSLALENEVELPILETLVNNGCDVNIIDRADENLIHQVIKKYTNKVANSLAYLAFLYEQGVDLHKPNSVQNTPLHLAVEFHKQEYIQWLLDNGADPNAQNKKGESPFFIAVGMASDLKKYELMRQYGTPDFDQQTTNGESLLYETLRMNCSPELLKLLLEDGADLYQTSTSYGRSVNSITILAEKSSEFLEIALDSGQLEINRQDDEGNTLLHKICSRETLHEEKRAKEVYRNAKFLLAAGADPNIVNSKEETPMQLASTDNLKTKTVELLLSKK